MSEKQDYKQAQLMVEETLQVITAGGLIALLLSAATLSSGPLGKVANSMLGKFLDHALAPNIIVFSLAGLLAGIAMTFVGAPAAKFLMDYSCRPLLKFMMHSCSLAIGAAIGLLFSMAFLPEIRAHAILLLFGIFLFALLLLEIGVALLVTPHRIIHTLDLKISPETSTRAIIFFGVIVMGLSCYLIKREVENYKIESPSTQSVQTHGDK